MSTHPIDMTRPPVHLRIGTAARTQGSGGTFDHVDPTTGQVDATIPLASPAEIDEASVELPDGNTLSREARDAR
jgi:aldehyde dehydrogenase (NAD+)